MEHLQMNRQVYIKAEQIARFIVKGIPITRIAIEMGMSYDGLIRITRQPEYLAIEDSVRQQMVAKMDQRLAKRAEMDLKREAIEEDMEEAVPEAMRILLDNVTKKRDLKSALEILDRDPQRQFAKGNKPVQAQQPPATLPQDTLQNTAKAADETRNMINRLPPTQPDQKDPFYN
jgi:hypothetical protein